ncbi:Retrovirus-related Pol polyprotein from transposon TNT 1-94 [Cardamine amara subsp. amara]|uniref:Retrovirus-related Pol polyprotein from transposon TNT 1-94 n=1 Tax=Cardamine amara subsp. amara TaxID=228776 RepID=A0ABD0ZVV9_CARAN
MTSRRDWFDTFEELNSGQVLLGDDYSVEVKGIGSINIHAQGGTVNTLTNVRYIPKLKRNLISTSTLDKLGFDHAGGKGKTRFYKNGKMGLQGTLCGSLYLLDGETVVGQSNISVTGKSAKDETVLWHRRLGHMSMKNLMILVKRGIIDKRRIGEMDFCDSCVMGKTKRLSFNIGKHNSGEALKYVHSDLWGSPSVTPSISGKQYFLSIIDDYTRKVWVFFLSVKSEAFTKFCEWKKLVENQINKKVKCLRTDNGLEFVSKDFDGFCK